MNKYDLLKRIGDPDQLAGVRDVTVNQGKGKNTRMFEVHNAAGLSYSLIADKCLDIFDFSYKGINISYKCKNGLVAHDMYNSLSDEVYYSFSPGMLMTCGLSNIGPGGHDNGIWRTPHGRLMFTPADQLCSSAYWEDDDYICMVSGMMRESRLYGYNMTLNRVVKTSLFSKEVNLHDTVTNCEPFEEEFLLLYHINFGYPLLDEGAKVYKSGGKVTGMPAYLDKELNYSEVTAPNDGSPKEQFVYYHENNPDSDGYAYMGIVNPELHLGVYIKYNADNLPVAVEWKSMVSHDYALALEPSNCYMDLREEERKKGNIKTIEPYGKREFDITLGILDGDKEINAFINKVSKL